MNYLILSRFLGLLFAFFGLCMLPAAAWSLYYGETRVILAFAGSIVVCEALGGGLWWLGRDAQGRMYSREALAIVGVGWLVAAALGGLPYLFGGMFASPVDAYFESMSGFTTTGASVLADIESQSRGLVFWRSFTHWLGGMGIIVLFISILPYLGAGGKQLFKNESPGPDPRGLAPKIRDTASILWKIYVGLTIALTVILMVQGMSFYDSLCHTFGTLATGGFSTRNASIGAYHSVGIEITVIFFMIVAGSNFSLFFLMWGRNWKALFKDPEWRSYMLILTVATAAITSNLWFESAVDGLATGLRDAAFSVASVMTTTGFVTADFDQWPHFSKAVLILLMFVGGCAGSTGGGLKVIRLMILWKIAWARIHKAYAPRAVTTLRIGGEVINAELQHTVLVFFLLFLSAFTMGTLVMTALGMDLISALSAVAATLNNIGPGMASVGPTNTYTDLPAVGKAVLSLLMVIGRIELFAILVLFSPGFWRKA
ncbi:MAG: potassium transporter [Deltaproteobacteria bacterium HGW-Deltaproteobacteria-22]|nr:MAG: potassium transporter [Deltaproteobacteria bacterium HGW-Deltaproteobacteria-22]